MGHSDNLGRRTEGAKLWRDFEIKAGIRLSSKAAGGRCPQQPCDPTWAWGRKGRQSLVIVQTGKPWTGRGMQRELPVPGVWAVAGGLGVLHKGLARLSLGSAFRF